MLFSMFDLVACKFFVLKVYTVYLLAHFFCAITPHMRRVL